MDLTGLTEKVTRGRWSTVYYEDEAGEIVAKSCGKCTEVKELGEFSRHPSALGGRETACKRCRAKYREENKEKIAERVAKYHEENKEKIVKYYEENKEKIAERKAKYREENKEKIAAEGARYRKENKEKIAKYKSGWAKENKDKRRVNHQRRRARKKALPDTLTTEQYAETLAYFGNACALTGEKLNLTEEHAIPLSIGHGGTIRENMYPMVDRLNFSKHDRNIFEWFEANRQRFELSQARFDKLIAWLASANAMTVEEYRDYVYWCHANPRETVA